MARQRRSDLPDGFFHVTARGAGRIRIYRHAEDRRFFLQQLAYVIRRFEWRCHAFCLMGNHYHLVLETSREQLSEGMRWLNGVYAQSFNGKYGRWGHLFGERFWSGSIDSEERLLATCLYVLENPVRAGLCADPDDWPWSGSRLDEDELRRRLGAH
jgi:putative transposase